MKPTLVYLNIRVLGEPIRFILSYAEVEFEDVRYERDVWINDHKSVVGFGKLPVFRYGDSEELTQSQAISRMLANKYNLTGSSHFENAKCDEYVSAANDWRQHWRTFYFETDPVKKEEIKANLKKIIIPKYLGIYNKIIQDNGSGFLVGNKVSWADFFITIFIELFEDTIDSKILEPFPTLKKYKDDIFSIPQISKWISNRPLCKI